MCAVLVPGTGQAFLFHSRFLFAPPISPLKFLFTCVQRTEKERPAKEATEKVVPEELESCEFLWEALKLRVDRSGARPPV